MRLISHHSQNHECAGCRTTCSDVLLSRLRAGQLSGETFATVTERLCMFANLERSSKVAIVLPLSVRPWELCNIATRIPECGRSAVTALRLSIFLAENSRSSNCQRTPFVLSLVPFHLLFVPSFSVS